MCRRRETTLPYFTFNEHLSLMNDVRGHLVFRPREETNPFRVAMLEVVGGTVPLRFTGAIQIRECIRRSEEFVLTARQHNMHVSLVFDPTDHTGHYEISDGPFIGSGSVVRVIQEHEHPPYQRIFLLSTSSRTGHMLSWFVGVISFVDAPSA